MVLEITSRSLNLESLENYKEIKYIFGIPLTVKVLQPYLGFIVLTL